MYVTGYSETSVVTKQSGAQPRRPQTKYLPLWTPQKPINLCLFFHISMQIAFWTQIFWTLNVQYAVLSPSRPCFERPFTYQNTKPVKVLFVSSCHEFLIMEMTIYSVLQTTKTYCKEHNMAKYRTVTCYRISNTARIYRWIAHVTFSEQKLHFCA
jgi:hypothetical protein